MDREKGGMTDKGMVDISHKKVVEREAEAVGVIELDEGTIQAVKRGDIKKGDPLEAAKISAIQAVKNTPDMLPYCHPIPVENIDIDFDMKKDSIEMRCRVKAPYKTGVEMEALSGVSVGLLTIWDMVKYLEKDEDGQYLDTRIMDIEVIEKTKKDK